MGFRLTVAGHANGDAGITPMAAEDEHERGRFAGICQAVFPTGPDGRPLPHGKTGVMRQVFFGAAEILLTERRLCAAMISSSGSLGRTDDERGTVIAVDVPYRALGSVALTRERRFFRGVKDTGVRCYAARPAGALDIEPVASVDPTTGKGTRTEMTAFFDLVTRLACADALTETLIEAPERRRLEKVRDGARTVEDLDVVAEIRG